MQIETTTVDLRQITAETLRQILGLSVSEEQKRFVASNAVSLAQALFAPSAWYRAIYVAEEPVGFVMLEDESLLSPQPEAAKVGVWRLMVAAEFQGRGIGTAAMLRVIEHVRSKGLFKALELSYVPGPGCPELFYLSLGFTHTGRMEGHEVVLEFSLSESAA